MQQEQQEAYKKRPILYLDNQPHTLSLSRYGMQQEQLEAYRRDLFCTLILSQRGDVHFGVAEVRDLSGGLVSDMTS
jgi:hypothetical protein